MALPAPQHQHDDEPAVRFSPEAYAQLAAIAANKGKSPAEYVRDALGMAQWIDEQLADGGSIVVRPKHRPWQVLRALR